MISQSIGVYRFTAKLGSGGMGEVYPVKDTSLDREVAIKILPRASRDPRRMAQFQREAEVRWVAYHGAAL
jgi:serine/threonine protein kinase